MSEKCKEFEHQYKDPRGLLAAWTAVNYQGRCPMYLNITQQGSMAEVTIRTPEVDGQQQTITFTVNYWTLMKLGEIFNQAAHREKIAGDRICEKCGDVWYTQY